MAAADTGATNRTFSLAAWSTSIVNLELASDRPVSGLSLFCVLGELPVRFKIR